MNRNDKPRLPFEIIAHNFVAEDDRDFWRTALDVLSEELILRRDEKPKSGDWILVVGVCSHWLRPHQTRWTARGGFAYPNGYQSFLPKLDWSSILLFRDRQWISAEKLPKKKQRLFRVAIPARTARHKQAVVHTRWSPGNETVLYGFRNLHGNWECVATSDEKVRGHIPSESRQTPSPEN
jgi:hypothetical protein